ncbi:restriction endonuclease subunit S [Actinomadura sp. 7K534]|uniref:restriction endonuclease subunit S n=1 Tax=Actinomadura sp. 7K534 TaxID=2530366 RepID=UPI001404D1C0|nr:restriction endonuclease subunit S [Actinomadura sp. 7K534]
MWALFDRVKDVGHPDEEMLSVYREHGVVKKSGRDDNFNKTAENRNIYQLVDPGWLVVNRMKAWQGSVGVSPYRGIVSGHYICFRPKHGEDPRYLNWLLRSPPYALEYSRISRGVRPNQVEIDNDDLRVLPVRLPPLEEQRRIADFLDAETARIDELRTYRCRQVSLLGERLSRIWYEVFADLGLRYGWVPVRRFVESLVDGPFGSSLTSSHYVDEGARVVRLGNIGAVEFKDENKAFIAPKYFRQLRRHEVVGGDLVIAGLGDEQHPLGRACIVPDTLGPAIVKADCFRVRLDSNSVRHDYAAWALSSPQGNEQARAVGRGTTRSRINLEVAKTLCLPPASIAEQKAAVQQMASVRRSIQAVSKTCETQLRLLEERRRAVITAAVTGELDVTTARRVS